MAATWPITLPQNPRRDLGWSPKGNVIAFGTEVGKGKRRRRSTYDSELWSLPFIMTDAQLADFKAFFADDLESGTLPFDYVYPRTGDTYRFTLDADQPYTVTYLTPLEQLVTLSLDGVVLP